MQQLLLFGNESHAEETRAASSWFHSILNDLSIENTTGWPDHFGRAIRQWLGENGHQLIPMLSVFSGGGGLDIGFADAGFAATAMIELENKYVRTLQANSGPDKYFRENQSVAMDIRTFHPSKDMRVDFIIGGPPCQTFSAAGRRASGVMGTDDPRGLLFEEYVRLLTVLQPRGFLFENVYGIIGAQQGAAWKSIQDAFATAGYHIAHRILDAADYGVPQHRERLFIVGLRQGTFLFPRPTHGPDSPGQAPYYTAKQAVTGAERAGISPGLHGQYGHLLQDIPPGLNYSFYTEKMGHPHPVFGWRSKFSDFLYKADPDAPTRTIKAQGGQYTGPFSWENRIFSIAELKRLQTIPDIYQVVGNRQVCIEQIGNSVPPQLARMLALSILHQVFDVPLPFHMEYLPAHALLGFRQRKRQLTAVYAQKAEMALEGPQNYQAISGVHADGDITRHLAPDFAWTTTPTTSSNVFRVTTVSTEQTWEIRVQSATHAPIEAYTIMLAPTPGKSWLLPTAQVKLYALDWSLQTFTALWKAFEEQLALQTGIADLVQLRGYYQYPSKFTARMQFPHEARDPLWPILDIITQGIGCTKPLMDTDFAQLFQLANEDVLPTFEQLRQIGFEVRNHHTNPQILDNAYLIPYFFPTLTPRSVQLRKKLRKPHD